jgi:hypothetical protein
MNGVVLDLEAKRLNTVWIESEFEAECKKTEKRRIEL